MSTVGMGVKKARTAKGWTQQELAERADISLDWVRSVESGRSLNPRLTTLAQAAAALGVTAESLMNGEPAPADDPSIGRYVTPEQVQVLNASFMMLQRLSPRGLKAAHDFLEVFARMDDDEFQNTSKES